MQQQNNNSQQAQSGQQGMGRVAEQNSMQNQPGSTQDISHIDQQEGNMQHGETGEGGERGTEDMTKEEDSQSRH